MIVVEGMVLVAGYNLDVVVQCTAWLYIFVARCSSPKTLTARTTKDQTDRKLSEGGLHASARPPPGLRVVEAVIVSTLPTPPPRRNNPRSLTVHRTSVSALHYNS